MSFEPIMEDTVGQVDSSIRGYRTVAKIHAHTPRTLQQQHQEHRGSTGSNLRPRQGPSTSPAQNALRRVISFWNFLA